MLLKREEGGGREQSVCEGVISDIMNPFSGLNNLKNLDFAAFSASKIMLHYYS